MRSKKRQWKGDKKPLLYLRNPIVSLLRSAGFFTIAARMRSHSVHLEAALKILSPSLLENAQALASPPATIDGLCIL